jgi:hypothetical protein
MDEVLFRGTIKVVDPGKTVETRYTVLEELTEWAGERNSQICDSEIP